MVSGQVLFLRLAIPCKAVLKKPQKQLNGIANFLHWDGARRRITHPLHATDTHFIQQLMVKVISFSFFITFNIISFISLFSDVKEGNANPSVQFSVAVKPPTGSDHTKLKYYYYPFP